MSFLSDGKRCPVAELSIGAIEQPFLITEAEIAETRNGKPYLRCTLADATGEVRANRWDTSVAPTPGIYLVSGLVEEYQGQLQVKLTGDLVPMDDDLSEYLKCSSFSPIQLRQRLRRHLDDLDGEIGQVVRAIFDDSDVEEAFFCAPAATKNHHAFRGGLAEHTISMANIANDVARHYHNFYGYDSVDRNLLIAGVLLHDLGKVYELQEEGFSWSRGTRGELVGHMVEVCALIHDACMACLASQDTRDRLMHMVLSHHGRNEWGSPVEPRLVEAMLLHQIDMMDSRFNMFRTATEGLEPGEMSERVWTLGGRVVR